jgi:hypothetical protein
MKWKLARGAPSSRSLSLRVCLAFGRDKFDFVGLLAGLRAGKSRGHAASPSFWTTASRGVSIATNGFDIGFVLDPSATGHRPGRAGAQLLPTHRATSLDFNTIPTAATALESPLPAVESPERLFD